MIVMKYFENTSLHFNFCIFFARKTRLRRSSEL